VVKTGVSKILKGDIPSLLCTQSGEGVVSVDERREVRLGGREGSRERGRRGVKTTVVVDHLCHGHRVWKGLSIVRRGSQKRSVCRGNRFQDMSFLCSIKDLLRRY
jgi:hypothetical protein